MTRHLWRGIWFVSFVILAACGGPEAQAPARTAAPRADYRTHADQFAALQRAALAADYPAFAETLGGRDERAVVAELQAAFGGGPFDVYTADAITTDSTHRRLVELRGPAARLYLSLALDRAPGGWNVAGYQLGRDRTALAGRP